MTKVFILICAIAVVAYAAVDSPAETPFKCDQNSDCNVSQCCSKTPRFLVVSKRQLSPPLSMFIAASCNPYLQLNESCIYVMKVNGDCGCAPDLVCKYFPELDAFNPMNVHLPTPPELQLTVAPSKRMAIPASPESYKCVPKVQNT
ncbi:uncharacterized protein LOC110459767 [Mizuhopecten yessoensis]|uniref:uncharacterized protein LOC110459767 n=1 Tax=Mizuhopecten yessoensis TaxID=6573 RepID=UPI000B45A533|nr:uncharacterized protein LOC110459767 [Mizuhopecten yessoensis]